MNLDAAIVLRPGDKVLVTFADDPTPAEADDLARGLKKSFPGVEFTFLTGVTGLAIQPPTTPEGS